MKRRVLTTLSMIALAAAATPAFGLITHSQAGSQPTIEGQLNAMSSSWQKAHQTTLDAMNSRWDKAREETLNAQTPRAQQAHWSVLNS